MKTRKLFLSALLLSVISCGQLLAQSPRTSNKTVCETQCTPEQKIDMVVKHVQSSLVLDDATAAQFAPLYKEYLLAMKDCCATNCPIKKGQALTDQEIKDLLNQQFDNQQKRLDLKKKYYKQFEKILNARQLQKLYMGRYNHHRGYGHAYGKDCNGYTGRHHNAGCYQGQGHRGYHGHGANCPR